MQMSSGGHGFQLAGIFVVYVGEFGQQNVGNAVS
jgi:hypothetical protein